MTIEDWHLLTCSEREVCEAKETGDLGPEQKDAKVESEKNSGAARVSLQPASALPDAAEQPAAGPTTDRSQKTGIVSRLMRSRSKAKTQARRHKLLPFIPATARLRTYLLIAIVICCAAAPLAWHAVRRITGTPRAILQSEKFGVDLIWVPPGSFIMGTSELEVEAAMMTDGRLERGGFAKEMPRHTVYLDGYYIFQSPVTVRQYLRFCDESGHEKPEPPDFNREWSGENEPIVNVSWQDANAYCDWASKETGLVVTLPTEAQWEKAARGTKGWIYPWGNRFDGARCRHSERKVGDARGTAPIGRYPAGASQFGVLDMAGNVCQWCSDLYEESYYQHSPARNPPGASTGSFRVLRGSSWLNKNESYFRCASRIPFSPYLTNNGDGFRCVVRVPR